MGFDKIRKNMESLWEKGSEGWRHLWASSANALTQFKAGDQTGLPLPAQTDGSLPHLNWSILGADLFEDEQRLVIKLEVPGLDKQDLKVEVLDGSLVVSGEKRFQQESAGGHWRILQRAYGSFRREIPLPSGVRAEAASAAYENGVLRIELPKQVEQPQPKGTSIAID